MKILINKIKKSIESGNVNFLLGSGLSTPFLSTLEGIEDKLTEAEKDLNVPEITRLKKEYFEKCMKGNLLIADEIKDEPKDNILEEYKNFFRVVNQVVLKRENTILTKQINVFTTNVDIFSEKALEDSHIEFNDGFHGRFNPIYEIGNFKKSVYRKSLHYENTSEIPVFNILKMHGSLSWKEDKKEKRIFYDRDLSTLRSLETTFNEVEYDKLRIINPKKTKFEDTVLNEYSYDLLRLYSNELEKENTVLFVMGFSFEDEHIRTMTLRAADSNPTLKIIIFKATSSVRPNLERIEKEAKNKNIEIIYPDGEEITIYDFSTITNKVFKEIVTIPDKFEESPETKDILTEEKES